MSDETQALYESMTDDDVAWFWNHGRDVDDYLGTLEEDLMVRGFEDLRRPNGKRNRRLRADDKDGWGAFFRENSEYWTGYTE
ncbi:MAG TPA: hypothetical protein VIM33_05750 [Gaiellaceae bacterium]